MTVLNRAGLRKHNLSRLLHVLRRHYRLRHLDWQEGLLQPPDDGAIVVGGNDGLYVGVSILGRSLSVSVTPPLGDTYTTVYRREQHASAEEAIELAPSVAAWALVIASEPPCDDDALSSAIKRDRLSAERRGLLSKLDRTPEDEARLEEIRAEIEQWWGMYETNEDREASDLIRRLAEHIKHEETP